VTDEPQIAALREEIRRAGGFAGRIRWFLVVIPPLLFAAYFFWNGLWTPLAHAPDPDPGRLNVGKIAFSAFMGGWAGIYGLAACLPIGHALAAGYRSRSRRRARRALGAVSSVDRASVLLPLRSSADRDTRVIVEELVRELDLAAELRPAELTPAAAPNARGDEASPAEKP
jgi:hypothetical protein